MVRLCELARAGPGREGQPGAALLPINWSVRNSCVLTGMSENISLLSTQSQQQAAVTSLLRFDRKIII